jgi:hypothetical protein
VRKRSEDIRSTEAAPQARRRGLAARLCLAATTLGLLVLCSSAQALEVPLLTGATGPTGPAGPTGAEGKAGPTGPTGTGGGGSGRETSEGTLASGKSETGAWAASIDAPSGAPQAQADGVISFPIPLQKSEELAGLKIVYRNAEQVLKPTAPCLGSTDEPVVEKGNLCVYRGGAGVGSQETIDKGVESKNPGFESIFGEKLTEIEASKGRLGLDIVFRTKQFNTTPGGAPATLTENAYMVAHGSWAVTEK